MGENTPLVPPTPISSKGYILSWDIDFDEYVAIRPDGSYIPIPVVGLDKSEEDRAVYMAIVTYPEVEDGCRATGDLIDVFREIVKFDEICLQEIMDHVLEGENQGVEEEKEDGSEEESNYKMS